MSDNTPPYYILDPRRLLPASATTDWLGRIITNFRDPREDFTPKQPQRFTDGLVDEIDTEEVQAHVSRMKENSVSAALAEIASVANGGGRSGGFSFQTGKMKVVRLSGYRNIFRAMRDDAEVRAHLCRALSPGGRPAYMIVRLLVWTDASLCVEQECSHRHGVGAQLPVLGVSSAVAGIPLPSLEIRGDPVLATSSRATHQARLSVSVPGSYIFALEYKAIRRRVYAVWTNARADWDGSGPRGKGDQHFNAQGESETDSEEEDEVQKEDNLDLDMEGDNSVWYDGVRGLDVEETELQSMILAVERAKGAQDNL